jgi:hypothetical protein
MAEYVPRPGDVALIEWYTRQLENILVKAFGHEMNGPWSDWAHKTLAPEEFSALDLAGIKLNPSVRRPDE